MLSVWVNAGCVPESPEWLEVGQLTVNVRVTDVLLVTISAEEIHVKGSGIIGGAEIVVAFLYRVGIEHLWQ